jgi:hypothetical protein
MWRLADTKANRAILAERDPRLVWSIIRDPARDDDAFLIVPGFWAMGEGWHLTTIPWDTAAQVVGYFKRD